jgi:hypothetical protein
MIVYDTALRCVFRNTNGIFIDNKYLETLKKAHLFHISDDVFKNIKGNCSELSVKDNIRAGRILTPFKNIWIEMPDITTNEIDYDGTILEKGVKRNFGFHLYEFDNKVYVLHRFSYYKTNNEEFVIPYTTIFRIFNGGELVIFNGVNSFLSAREEGRKCKYFDDNSFKNIVANFERTESVVEAIEAMDGFIEKEYKDIMAYTKIEPKFCLGPKNKGECTCTRECLEAIRISKDVINTALTILSFINTPYYRIVFQNNNTVKSSGKSAISKKPIYGLNRPHYILIDHERTVNLFKNSEEYKKGSSNYKIRGHDRRKHKRMVTGRQGKNGWIPYKEMVQWVRETWVGPKEFTVGESIYKIIDSGTK